MKEDNIIFHEDHIEIELNPRIYKLSTVFSAAYILSDKAYIVIDGDPKKSLKISLRPKDRYNLKKLAHEFNDEILNYSVYEKQSLKNQQLRENMLKRALLTNLTPIDDYTKDEEEILVPWEKKYGKK